VQFNDQTGSVSTNWSHSGQSSLRALGIILHCFVALLALESPGKEWPTGVVIAV